MTPDAAHQPSESGAATVAPAPGWRRLGPAAAALLCAAAVLTGVAGYSYDDAFITYRYALNLAEEGRLAFNPGPATYGTTAPGYAVLLAGLGRVSPGSPATAIPVWGSLLGVAGLLTVPLVLLAWPTRPRRAGDGVGSRRAWLVVAAPLLVALRWNVEMLGGETLPAMGLVALGAFLLFARKVTPGREIAAGLVLAAAAMLRLDAGLAAVIFGLVVWQQRRRAQRPFPWRSFPWRLALAGTVPLALYVSGLWAWFGHVLPDTLGAKQAETVWVSGSLTAAQWAWLTRTLSTPGAVTLLSLAAAGVAALLAARAWRRPAPAAAGLWLAGHEIAYRLLGVPFAPWYHGATVTAVVLLAGFGAAALARWGFARLGVTEPPPLALSAATLALLLPVILPTVSWWASTWGQPPDPRWGVYHLVGEHIRAHSAPDDEVAAVEIGFLAYSSRRPVLDLMGLVSPGVVPAREAGALAVLVAQRRPRYILDVPLFRRQVLDGILLDGRIAGCYAAATTFPAPELMGGEVTLLERQPGPGCP